MKTKLFVFSLLISFSMNFSQAQKGEKKYTRADTLRGTIGVERAWWNIQFYDLPYNRTVAIGTYYKL